MKVRINKAGWEKYTGRLSDWEFVDGVSIEKLPEREKQRLGSILPLVEIDDEGEERPTGAAQRLLETGVIRAEIAPNRIAVEDEEALTVAEGGEASVETVAIYTREDLEQVASDQGIRGLRVIAETWDVKHTSITGLIGEIIAAQSAYTNEQAGDGANGDDTVTGDAENAGNADANTDEDVIDGNDVVEE